MCLQIFVSFFFTPYLADVITIENSKSDAKLLGIFEHKNYTNEIGPGLYDIHSPRVPSVEEIRERLQEMLRYIPKHLLWVNPDCGLVCTKTLFYV